MCGEGNALLSEMSEEGELVIMASYCVRNSGTQSPYVKYGFFAFLISVLYLIHANVAPISLDKMPGEGSRRR